MNRDKPALDDPAIASDAPRILAAYAYMDEAQKTVNHLYEGWHVLDEKARA